MLGWPLEVSASHISQLQFAAAVETILDTALHQVWYCRIMTCLKHGEKKGK